MYIRTQDVPDLRLARYVTQALLGAAMLAMGLFAFAHDDPVRDLRLTEPRQHGADVLAVQMVLLRNGYLSSADELDGYHGPVIEAGVLTFQHDQGLPAHDMVDPGTANALFPNAGDRVRVPIQEFQEHVIATANGPWRSRDVAAAELFAGLSAHPIACDGQEVQLAKPVSCAELDAPVEQATALVDAHVLEGWLGLVPQAPWRHRNDAAERLFTGEARYAIRIVDRNTRDAGGNVRVEVAWRGRSNQAPATVHEYATTTFAATGAEPLDRCPDDIVIGAVPPSVDSYCAVTGMNADAHQFLHVNAPAHRGDAVSRHTRYRYHYGEDVVAVEVVGDFGLVTWQLALNATGDGERHIVSITNAGTIFEAANAFGLIPVVLNPMDPEPIAKVREQASQRAAERVQRMWEDVRADPSQLFHLVTRATDGELVALLAKANIDVNVRDQYGQTPLMYAASIRSLAVVDALLEAGANPNARTDANWTALMYAARDTFERYVILRLADVANDPDARNQGGETAIDLMRKRGADRTARHAEGILVNPEAWEAPTPRTLIVRPPHMHGEDVASMQERLLELQYLTDAREVDGYYGPVTAGAIQSFQKEAGLTASGVVGPTTRAVLEAPIAPVSPEPTPRTTHSAPELEPDPEVVPVPEQGTESEPEPRGENTWTVKRFEDGGVFAQQDTILHLRTRSRPSSVLNIGCLRDGRPEVFVDRGLIAFETPLPNPISWRLDDGSATRSHWTSNRRNTFVFMPQDEIPRFLARISTSSELQLLFNAGTIFEDRHTVDLGGYNAVKHTLPCLP